MTIEIAKPLPIKLGNRYLYTLTSYEPVKVEVTVEQTSDAEIELTLESLAKEGGIERGAMDDAWVAAHTAARTVDELKASLARERDRAVAGRAEEAKYGEALQALAKRLGQKVPDEEVARYRAMLLRSNELDAGSLGLSLDDLLRQIGSSRAEFDKNLEEQALATAEREAALSAFAAERKLTVDESEIPYLLGVGPERGATLVDQAKRSGGLDDLKAQCLNSKAARVVAAECTCVYKMETPEEAARRLQAMRDALAALDERVQAAGSNEGGATPPDLKLV